MTITDEDLHNAKNHVFDQGLCCQLLPKLAGDIEAKQARIAELEALVLDASETIKQMQAAHKLAIDMALSLLSNANDKGE